MGIFDEYKTLMNRIDPPDNLDERVAKAIDDLRKGTSDEKHAHEHDGHRAIGHRQRRRPHLFPRLAVGLVAASLAVGAIIAIPSLVTDRDRESNTQEPSLPSFSGVFGLALYAEASEEGQSVAIATGESGIRPHGGTGGPRPSALQYLVNLKCIGENIDTVTYRIEGEDVRFELIEMQDSEFGDHLNPKTYTHPHEITVDYEEQQSEYYIQRLDVDLRTQEQRAFDLIGQYTLLEEQFRETTDPDEQEKIQNEIRALGEEQSRRNNEGYASLPEDPEERTHVTDELYLAATLEAAQKIGQSTLSVTATFLDGTTTTQQYKITPVDNYEQAFSDRITAVKELGGNPEALEADTRMTAPLFTISEAG